MKTIELFVHSSDGVDPKLVKSAPESTIADLLKACAEQGGFGGRIDDNTLVFAEDGEEPLEPNLKLSECDIRHRQHVHLHRCRKVKVSVFYNREISETFSPATKVKRVLKWAIKAFELTQADAAGKILVLKGQKNQELPTDAHIGSFAQPGQCAVELCLTAPVEVQG